MSLEIERRFLVRENGWENHVKKSLSIRQGYLFSEKNKWTARVRVIGTEESMLTLKYPKKGIERYEYEYPIPRKDAEEILKKSISNISKIRHEIIFRNQLWIVDCFSEKNFPLVIAEIELSSINQEIFIPSWCGEEISNNPEFSNASLSKKPLSSWELAKRHSIL